MNTRETIIEALYKHFNELVYFATPLTRCKYLAEDVTQNVYIQLMTSDNNRLMWIYADGGGLNYLKKIIAVRVLSKKSQFNRKHLAYFKNKVKCDTGTLEHFLSRQGVEMPNNYKDALKQKLDSELEKFTYYERTLFNLYYESNITYDDLARETGIPKINIYNTVRKVKKQLKQTL